MKNIENKKLPQMLLFNMCEDWKKIWHHFGLFLSLFLTFHLNILQLCKKLPSYISGTHQLMFPLVNNGQKWCNKLCNSFLFLHLLQGECGYNTVLVSSRWQTEILSLDIILFSSLILWYKEKSILSFPFMHDMWILGLFSTSPVLSFHCTVKYLIFNLNWK